MKQGETVLLCLAGNLCSPQVFDQIRAPRGFQKIYVDYLRSPGPWDMDSMGEHLVEAVRKSEVSQIILAGYSAGGVLAISAVSKAPELFDGLLLSNTGPCSIGHGNPEFARELREHFDDERYIRSFLQSCFYKPVSRMMEDQLYAYTRGVSADAACEAASSLRVSDYRETLAEYDGPVVIAHGKLDTRRKLDSVEMLKRCLPQAEVVLLETGHTPMFEDPAGYQKALHSLFKKIKEKQK